MTCTFPRCECLCHPDNCIFQKKYKKGKNMDEQNTQSVDMAQGEVVAVTSTQDTSTEGQNLSDTLGSEEKASDVYATQEFKTVS